MVGLGDAGDKNLSVGICDGTPSTARYSFNSFLISCYQSVKPHGTTKNHLSETAVLSVF